MITAPGEDLTLYFILSYCAIAVEEEGSALAEACWLEACFAVSGLYDPCSRPDRAAWVIIRAARPGRDGDRVALRDALNAATLAVLPVKAGSLAAERARELAPAFWRDAYAAADCLPLAWRSALRALLEEAKPVFKAEVPTT